MGYGIGRVRYVRDVAVAPAAAPARNRDRMGSSLVGVFLFLFCVLLSFFLFG